MCFYGAYAQTSLQVMTFHSRGGDQLDQPRCSLYTRLRNKFAISESKELSWRSPIPPQLTRPSHPLIFFCSTLSVFNVCRELPRDAGRSAHEPDEERIIAGKGGSGEKRSGDAPARPSPAAHTLVFPLANLSPAFARWIAEQWLLWCVI